MIFLPATNHESPIAMTAATPEFDYVIVGAGSAGCVLAARLTEDPEVSVLLLEAGGADPSLMMQIPAGVYKVFHNPRFNWNYESEPQSELAGRRIPGLNACLRNRPSPLGRKFQIDCYN